MSSFHNDQAAGLRRIMEGPKPRIVSLLSASAGNELPRILSNLAASLQQHGSDALIVHAAEGSADSLRQYQLTGLPTLADVANGKHARAKAIRQTTQGYSTANLIPAHLCGRPLQHQLAQQLGFMVNALAGQHEIVLVEATLNDANQLPLAMLNDGEILIQLDRKPASIQHAYRLIKQLYGELGTRPFGILVNGANEIEAQAVFNNIDGVARRYLRLNLDYVGHIPADEHLLRASKLGRSVIDAFPMAAVSQALNALAARLDYRRQASALATASYS